MSCKCYLLALHIGLNCAIRFDGDGLSAGKLDHDPAGFAECDVGIPVAIDVDLLPNATGGSPPDVRVPGDVSQQRSKSVGSAHEALADRFRFRISRSPGIDQCTVFLA